MRFAYQEILVSVDREDRSSLQFLDFLLQRLYLASEIDLAQASFRAQFWFYHRENLPFLWEVAAHGLQYTSGIKIIKSKLYTKFWTDGLETETNV